MLILLSPAKSLDFDKPTPDHEASTPHFGDDAVRLAGAAAKLGPKRLRELMSISPALATLNARRFREFATAPERAALFAFAGDVYRGLDAPSLSAEALIYADAHLRLLSGLYGVLRPLDLIKPYRLEMGTKWAPGRAKDLYEFWGRRVSDVLTQDLERSGEAAILDLASREYAEVVLQAPPPHARITRVDFRELGPKGLRFNSFAAKHARGRMARWCCERRIDGIEDVRAFAVDGYAFDPDGSTSETMQFVRTI